MMKKLITVAERHNSDIDVLKQELTNHIEQWNDEYKNLFSFKELDWYDNFGMLKIIIIPTSNKLQEELYIVLNLGKSEIRVLVELPEVIDIFSCTLEAVMKKKLKEVIKITEEKVVN